MKIIKVAGICFILSLLVILLLKWLLLGPVTIASKPSVYIKSEETLDVAGELAKAGYIRNANAFQLLYLVLAGDKKIEAGGYRLDSNMHAWQIVQKLSEKPDLVWVSMREGLRKEQVGEIVGAALGWNEAQRITWNTLYTLDTKPDFAEGVYFPDTYLLPRDETVEQIAQRFIDRFNEKFAPFLSKFTEKNIRWTTGLKIASLIQREAGGTEDMRIISGIIWNRLDKDMKLEIDATMQYTKGKIGDKWWGKIDLSEKKSNSPYNTYVYKGLPPTPIANPGLAAIDAALNPQETDCIFYLHGSDRQIHCAITYEEHLQNIEEYLR
ncbi:endolytic transglycosylase MltG [Candidatus Woesebacteria bacterium]|nr:endolytic transglycosylase MltG [Candidatus Woesebacteria bacterium]